MPTLRRRRHAQSWSFDNPRIRTLLLIGQDYAFVGLQVPYPEGQIPEDVLREAWLELKDSITQEHKRKTEERLQRVEEELTDSSGGETRTRMERLEDRDKLKAELAQPGGPKPWGWHEFEETK